VFCTTCGSENVAGSLYCARCGAALPATSGETSAVGSSAPPAPKVGPDATTIFSPGGDDAESEFSAAAHQGEVDALAPGSALLVVRRGPNAGSRFLLDEDVTTAGRHPDSDIFLDDVTVSRRHAEFRRDGDGFAVHDVGSLNGTYVNRERIESCVLSGGDEVQIGKFRLVLLTSANLDGAAETS
jgi:pSer/pThr/pTyr-binding forkhead associated (FHA) protein